MEIILSPSKTLYICPEISETADTIFISAFNKNFVNGLLSLANSPEHRAKSPSTRYWYEFSGAVLRNFFTIKVNSDFDASIDDESITHYLNLSPNISGQEYLDRDSLTLIWQQLNDALQGQLTAAGGDVKKFIESSYPSWNQVGRIHFHIAENNKPDKDFPFVFLATYTTRVSNKARIQHIPLGKVIADFADRSQTNLLLSVLTPIKTAVSSSPFFENFVASKKVFQTTYLSSSDTYHLLKESTQYEQSGIVVKLPKKWGGSPPPKAKVSVKIENSQGSFVGFNSLLRFNVNVTIGGETLNDQEIKDLLNQNQKISQIRGKWVEIDKEKLETLLEKWKKATYLQNHGLSFGQAIRSISKARITRSDADTLGHDETMDSWLEFIASKEIEKTINDLLNPSNIQMNSIRQILAKHLHASLRPYQKDGVKWLHLLCQLGLGGCLADDMGLGKTIQIISLLLLETKTPSQQPSPNLLIVPASLLGNWESELKKFAPSLIFAILHRSYTPPAEIERYQSKTKNLDLVITTYSMVKKIRWLKELTWNLLIVDEAQAIKNPQAQQTRSIKELHSRIKIAMTGTPIENNLTDLWSLFDFCCPSLLGNHSEFKRFHHLVKEKGSYESIRKLINPYILRRKKTDKSIISDLPDKTEIKSYCLLTKQQIKLYQQTVNELISELQEAQNSEIERKASILKYLMRFKQICNHPSQFHNDNVYDYEKSGKFFRLKEIATTIHSRGEKVLIFTQFREITDVLCAYLTEIFHRQGLVLHGGTPVKKRKEIVEEFQKDASAPFLVLSLKAGGTGLNLTKASHVIHFDRWWNPAVENQATDRAFRIGQKKNVVVHKFICKGTIEENIDLMIDSKRDLSESIVEASKDFKITELNNEEIVKLISLDIQSAEI